MNILLTNDDGIGAKGLETLIDTLRPYGKLTVVAPKRPQSGMSMAVSLGFNPIGVRKLSEARGEQRWYLDGSPASCVKFGLDNILYPAGIKPDVVVSGVNHGSNAATASLYSGTIGAAMEAAVNGIPGIGVSLDSFDSDADFSAVKELFPEIFELLMSNYPKGYGNFINVNFPALPASEIKGRRVCRIGRVHWEKEYIAYDEFLKLSGRIPKGNDAAYIKSARAAGEEIYVMAGVFTDNNDESAFAHPADHRLLADGYITIVPQNIDNTAPEQTLEALEGIF